MFTFIADRLENIPPKRASLHAVIDVCFNIGICIQIANSLDTEMQNVHQIHFFHMFSRNCIGFSRECFPFKALEFMKNPSVSDKLEVSGEIKSRQSISKGISPSVLYFIGQHINLQVQALYCFSEGNHFWGVGECLFDENWPES